MGQAGKYAFLLFHLAFTLLPFYWMLITALKSTQADIYAFPVTYWPSEITLKNFTEILTTGNFFIYFKNSFVYASMAAIAGTFIAILASYALSRFRFKGRNLILFFFILTQMLARLYWNGAKISDDVKLGTCKQYVRYNADIF